MHVERKRRKRDQMFKEEGIVPLVPREKKTLVLSVDMHVKMVFKKEIRRIKVPISCAYEALQKQVVTTFPGLEV
jgi:hypothetical protein